MKIKFCGAAGTTTGSQHLIEVNGAKILLDCGMFQGRRQESYERNKNFNYFDPKEIDAVILSHAHIDHSGNLPNLAKNGFRGNVYCTDATRDLCQIMLADSARIQAADAFFLNKHKKPDDAAIEPLYSEQDAAKVMGLFVMIGYERPLPITRGVTLRFYNAGHILGSAQIVLDIDDEEDGKHKRLLFSGDVGRGNNEILPNPVPVPDVDIVLIESTYGGREHEAPPRDDAAFIEVIKRSLARGGKIFIPSFAVERTQQLLYILHKLFKEGILKEIPVFVDSPLAVSATEIFRIHPECFNDDLHEFMETAKDPFGFEHLRLIRAIKESKELNSLKGQAIIIAASGMCEAGRILHHLINGIGNSRNTVLFVGYCAEYTLGWKIRMGYDDVNILGGRYSVKAPIEILDSFSGHADHSELLDYFYNTGGKKDQVFIIHGEPERSIALQKALDSYHDARYERPIMGEEFTC